MLCEDLCVYMTPEPPSLGGEEMTLDLSRSESDLDADQKVETPNPNPTADLQATPILLRTP